MSDKKRDFKGKPFYSFPVFVFTFLFFNSSFLFGQETEIGFGVGGFRYSGELVRGIGLNSINPAGTVFFRNNISEAVSFRVSLTGGRLAGSDSQTTIDPFADQRGASFSIFLLEASAGFEYHFLKWRQEHTLIRWTPYFFGGLAIFGISGEADKPAEYSNIQPSIPFGFGIKYILNPKWYLGVEFGARKTFFDYLDNLSDGDVVVKNFQTGNRFDNDAYYHLGLSLTYSFYTIPCPNSPYKRNYRNR
ncbi:MAG: DUF6089 family protein [Bacteroidota bacterium]